MLITPIKISTYNYKKIQPQFKANYNDIKDEKGNLLYLTTTFMYRADLDWDNLADFVKNKYKNTKKVTIIDHACSDGSEAYSLAMSLIMKMEGKAQKFFPIIAKDLNKENIEIAKKGEIPVSWPEIFSIDYYTKKFSKRFFETDSLKDYKCNCVKLLKIKPKLKKNIVFSQSDVMGELDSLPTTNTIFMFRNVWPYLKAEDRTKLADKLAEFDDTCLVIIGEYDNNNHCVCSVQNMLKNRGFYPVGANIYQKMEKPPFSLFG